MPRHDADSGRKTGKGPAKPEGANTVPINMHRRMAMEGQKMTSGQKALDPVGAGRGSYSPGDGKKNPT